MCRPLFIFVCISGVFGLEFLADSSLPITASSHDAIPSYFYFPCHQLSPVQQNSGLSILILSTLAFDTLPFH